MSVAAPRLTEAGLIGDLDGRGFDTSTFLFPGVQDTRPLPLSGKKYAQSDRDAERYTEEYRAW